jgi:hypothetical protein
MEDRLLLSSNLTGTSKEATMGVATPRNRSPQAMDILSTRHRVATILQRCHRGGAAAEWALQALPLWAWEAVCSAVLCSQKHSMTMGTRSSITMVMITVVTMVAAMTLAVTFEFAEMCTALFAFVFTCFGFSF